MTKAVKTEQHRTAPIIVVGGIWSLNRQQWVAVVVSGLNWMNQKLAAKRFQAELDQL